MTKQALNIIRERYADFGPTLACEKLREVHGLKLSKETIRKLSISTMEAANAYAPCFIADYNRRFAKSPRNDWDAHRPLREDEDLELIFTHREKRKVSHVLTLQYDKTIYLIGDTKTNRKLIGQYIDVCEYVDGRIELQASGTCLPYTTYDRLPEVSQGAIVENKRLGHVLQIAQVVQAERDSRRSQSAPARTHRGLPRAIKKAEPSKKRQRALDATDMEKAIRQSTLAT